jgi:hypothetical protein
VKRAPAFRPKLFAFNLRATLALFASAVLLGGGFFCIPGPTIPKSSPCLEADSVQGLVLTKAPRQIGDSKLYAAEFATRIQQSGEHIDRKAPVSQANISHREARATRGDWQSAGVSRRCLSYTPQALTRSPTIRIVMAYGARTSAKRSATTRREFPRRRHARLQVARGIFDPQLDAPKMSFSPSRKKA